MALCFYKPVFNLFRDEKVISRAIDLNEQLEKVLARHDAHLSGRRTSTPNYIIQEETEEEAEQLFRRYGYLYWVYGYL